MCCALLGDPRLCLHSFFDAGHSARNQLRLRSVSIIVVPSCWKSDITRGQCMLVISSTKSIWSYLAQNRCHSIPTKRPASIVKTTPAICQPDTQQPEGRSDLTTNLFRVTKSICDCLRGSKNLQQQLHICWCCALSIHHLERRMHRRHPNHVNDYSILPPSCTLLKTSRWISCNHLLYYWNVSPKICHTMEVLGTVLILWLTACHQFCVWCCHCWQSDAHWCASGGWMEPVSNLWLETAGVKLCSNHLPRYNATTMHYSTVGCDCKCKIMRWPR